LVRSNAIDEKSVAELAAVENIKANVTLINKDKLLKESIESGKVKVLGAKYYLETGSVDFY
jgi:carbonic anhydrase